MCSSRFLRRPRFPARPRTTPNRPALAVGACFLVPLPWRPPYGAEIWLASRFRRTLRNRDLRPLFGLSRNGGRHRRCDTDNTRAPGPMKLPASARRDVMVSVAGDARHLRSVLAVRRPDAEECGALSASVRHAAGGRLPCAERGLAYHPQQAPVARHAGDVWSALARDNRFVPGSRRGTFRETFARRAGDVGEPETMMIGRPTRWTKHMAASQLKKGRPTPHRARRRRPHAQTSCRRRWLWPVDDPAARRGPRQRSAGRRRHARCLAEGPLPDWRSARNERPVSRHAHRREDHGPPSGPQESTGSPSLRHRWLPAAPGE